MLIRKAISQIVFVFAVLPIAAQHGAVSAPPSNIPILSSGDITIYRGDGDRAGWDELINEAMTHEAILLGEQHDDSVGHVVQGNIYQDLHERHTKTILSLEMFERDVQNILDEYLSDVISESHFLRAARPWDNYQRDYRPSVEYAKSNNIPVVAANAPRRYVNRVSRLGLTSLDELHLTDPHQLPPLPVQEPSADYQQRWDVFFAEMGAAHGSETPTDGPRDPFSQKMLEAQTLWDASMAWSIGEALMSNPSAKVVHYVGSFHVEKGNGIRDHLLAYRPHTEILTIVIRPAADHRSLPEDAVDLGDFVILTPSAP